MDCLKSRSLVACLILCACISIQADDDYLHAIVDALKLCLQFYADNYMNMNIDGIFGLRIVEGMSFYLICFLLYNISDCSDG